MRWSIGFPLLALTLCSVCDPAAVGLEERSQKPVIKSDQKQLQGTWKVISSECDGETADPSSLEDITLTFSGNDFVVKYKAQVIKRGTYTIDASTMPKQMDVIAPRSFTNRRAMLGIYELKLDDLKV